MPIISEATLNELGKTADAAVQDWIAGLTPVDDAAKQRILEYLSARLQPLLGAVRWPRWLHLERAFLDGSATGDLLFASLALRCLCEEVRWQHALDLPLSDGTDPRSRVADSDQPRVDQFLRVARGALIALPFETIAHGIGWPSLDQSNEVAVYTAQQALNDYVHPNYGSHVAALRPREAAAGRVLLEGCIAVFESFFSLSWAEKPVIGPTRSLGLREPMAWPASKRRFLRITLPYLQDWRSEPSLQMDFRADAVRNWLTAVPGDLAVVIDERAKPEQRPSWEGSGPPEVVLLDLALRCSERLEQEFPRGAPTHRVKHRFLAFTSDALQLCLLFDDLKAAAARVQLVRQLNIGNELAVQLCVRTLLEHKAVRDTLLKQLGSAWESTAKRVVSGSALPDQASGLDRHIGKFLASTKGTEESPAPWIMIENQGRRVASLNLKSAVEEAFLPHDGYREIYDLACAVVHGRYGRGIDLAADEDGKVEISESALAVRVLDRLLIEAQPGRDGSAPFILSLQHVLRQSDTDSNVGRSRLQLLQMFGQFATAELKLGRDYHGAGTRSDPFLMSRHLQFHLASVQLLRQLGMTTYTRTPGIQPCADGSYCDHYVDDAAEHWIQVPFLVGHDRREPSAE